MLYEEFKNYLLSHLWKEGDVSVQSALDIIIKTSTTELNRVLKVEDRVVAVNITFETTSASLPVNCQEIRHLYHPTRGEMKYIIPADFANQRAGRIESNTYTVINRNIVLPAGSMTSSSPLNLTLWYYTKIAPYDEVMVDLYFDVFLYCALKHTAPFLREDERLDVWDRMYSTAFISALEENEQRKYAGSPLKIKFPGSNGGSSPSYGGGYPVIPSASTAPKIVVRPEDFSGATEEKIISAINEGMSSNTQVWLSGDYTIGSALPAFDFTTQRLYVGGTGRIFCAANMDVALHFRAAYVTPKAVSSVILTTYAFPGVATVASIATKITSVGHGLAIGDIFKIVSDDVLPIAADPNPRRGEFVYAADIIGDDIYVAGSLLNTYVTNIRLARLWREADFSWDGPKFAATPAQPNWHNIFLQARSFVSPYIRTDCEDGYNVGVNLSSCYMAKVEVTGRNMRNRVVSEGVSGYLVQDSSSGYTTANIDGTDARHCYTTDSPNPEPNDPLYLYGQTYGAKVTGSFIATSSAAFDTHTEAVDITFHDIITGSGRLGEAAPGSGAGLRGTRIKVMNGIDRGSVNGLQFTAQVLGGCTDCSVINWNYDGAGDGLRFNDGTDSVAVRPTVRGGRIRTSKNRSVAMWDVEGGVIENLILAPSGSAVGTTGIVLHFNVQVTIRGLIIDLSGFTGTQYRAIALAGAGNRLLLESPRLINGAGKFQTWVNAASFDGSVVIIDPQSDEIPSGGVVIAGESLTTLQQLASMKAQAFPVATLPSAVSEGAGTIVWTTNGNAGVLCPAISDGATWRRIALGTTVSPT